MNFWINEFFQSGSIMNLSKEKLLIGWGEPYYVTDQELDNQKPAFYFTDFFLKKSRPWIQYENWMEISIQDFKNLLNHDLDLSTSEWVIHNPEQFRKAFNQLSDHLKKDELKKAVPYVFAKSTDLMTPNRLQNCLKKSLLSIEQKKGNLYGYWNLSDGILGISPEILFTHSEENRQKVQTMALAGTSHPSQCQEAFLKNEKEQYEHGLVVEGICQALKGLGSIKVGNQQLLQLTKISHLMTLIEIELNCPFNFEVLINHLHPTPALGAFPVNEGKKWLNEFQLHTPRHFYGAPIGFKHPEKGLSRCIVGIRNVQWNEFGMRIAAGCGVVKQSTFEKEWQEIHIKIRAIRDQLYL